MQPTTRSFADAVRVFIVPMSAEDIEAQFPNVRGLPAGSDVFVVMSEAGAPLLITDTRAEALRQVQQKAGVVLGRFN